MILCLWQGVALIYSPYPFLFEFVSFECFNLSNMFEVKHIVLYSILLVSILLKYDDNFLSNFYFLKYHYLWKRDSIINNDLHVSLIIILTLEIDQFNLKHLYNPSIWASWNCSYFNTHTSHNFLYIEKF